MRQLKSAYPGKVGTGFPKRICANSRAHIPEKWAPVFRKGYAPTQEVSNSRSLEHVPISTEGHALMDSQRGECRAPVRSGMDAARHWGSRPRLSANSANARMDCGACE